MNLDKGLILNRIKLCYKLEKDSDLARFLGVKPQTLANWYARNSIDYDVLFTKCLESDINWILTGRKEVKSTNNTVQIFNKEDGVPLYAVGAAAGYNSFDELLSEEKITDYYKVPEFKGADFLIHITGSSMAPKYVNGDVVACKIIKDSLFIQWGRVHVIGTKNQGLLCKRVTESEDKNCIRVISENEKYHPFDIPKEEILGMALVIGVIHFE